MAVDKMEKARYGGPVYTGAPALTVTASLVQAGGGASGPFIASLLLAPPEHREASDAEGGSGGGLATVLGRSVVQCGVRRGSPVPHGLMLVSVLGTVAILIVTPSRPAIDGPRRILGPVEIIAGMAVAVLWARRRSKSRQ